MSKGVVHILFLWVLPAVCVVLFIAYSALQPVVNYAEAPLFDGNAYLAIYDFLKGNATEYEVAFPFHSRVLVPWLATSVPVANPLVAFQYVNLFFMVLAVLLLYRLWYRLALAPYLVVLGMCWLLLHWTGLVRLNVFDPITVDVPLYAFQALFLLIVYHRKWLHLLWLGPLATVHKESFPALLVLLLCFAAGYWWLKKDRHTYNIGMITLALVLSVVAKYVANAYFVPATPGHSSVVTVAWHLREVWYDPFRLVRWLAAIFVAYGAMLWLPLALVKQKPDIEPFTVLLALFSLLYFFFGIAAGGDMLRIVFLGFPFVFTLILKLATHLKAIAVVWAIRWMPPQPA